MSKRVLKKSKRRSKAVLPALGIAGLSFSVPSAGTASTGDAMDIPSASQPHQLFLGEEEIFDTSLSTFYTFDKENGEQTSLAQGLKLARGGGGCGCGGHGGCGGRGGCGGGCAVHAGCGGCARAGIGCARAGIGCARAGLSVALADARFRYTADARFLDAASAAVAVAAEAAAVGAAELAGYGHPPGVGSTPAGPNLHRLVKKLASRRSRSLKQGWPRERSNESHCQSSST